MKNSSSLLILLAAFQMLIGCTDKEKKYTPEKRTTEQVTQFEPTEFLFVGMYYGNDSIYKYNIGKKSSTVYWYDTKEKVIILLYKTEEEPAYFITARKLGKRGGFPLVSKIKLYRIDPLTNEKVLVKEFGDGLQITAYYDDNNNVEVVYTAIDNTISSYINKYKLTYNYFGKLINDEMETFDIAKDGFPALLPKRSSTVSPSGKYGISITGNSLFLKISGIDTLKFIDTLKYDFNKVKWNDDESFMIIAARDSKINYKENASIYVYNIDKDSVTAKWFGAGLMNFNSLGDLLIFDKGIANKSAVYIYNLKKNKMLDIIKIYGGCGIMNVYKFY